MVTLSHLFSPRIPLKGYNDTVSALSNGIDAALEKGDCDKEVLHLMKDLINELEIPTMSDYVEEVQDG